MAEQPGMPRSPETPGAPQVEQEPTPERKEAAPAPETAPSESASTDSGPAPVTPLPVDMPKGPAPVAKDAERMRVERVLEDNLWEVYRALPDATRTRFRARGETLAAEMRAWLDEPKVKAGSVYDAVRGWLKMIPRVNKWFLWQEAKIKTDRWSRIRADRAGSAAEQDGIHDV